MERFLAPGCLFLKPNNSHHIYMNNTKEGTVTISLAEYHRLTGLENTLQRFTSEPNTILIHSYDYSESTWWIIRPDEATEVVADRLNREIETLNEELKKRPIKNDTLRVKKWYEVFGL